MVSKYVQSEVGKHQGERLPVLVSWHTLGHQGPFGYLVLTFHHSVKHSDDCVCAASRWGRCSGCGHGACWSHAGLAEYEPFLPGAFVEVGAYWIFNYKVEKSIVKLFWYETTCLGWHLRLIILIRGHLYRLAPWRNYSDDRPALQAGTVDEYFRYEDTFTCWHHSWIILMCSHLSHENVLL